VDKTAIYRKTGKGAAEVNSAERSIDRRLRPLLILVDGHRTALGIYALISAIGIREQDFDDLVDGGYIEAVARPGGLQAEAGGAAPGLPAPSRSSLERYTDGKRYLCETAADKLGLMSTLFVLKLERCSSVDELAGLLPDFEKAIGKKLDPGYAYHCRRIAESLLYE
jgi:hypothetical protein